MFSTRSCAFFRINFWINNNIRSIKRNFHILYICMNMNVSTNANPDDVRVYPGEKTSNLNAMFGE